MTVLNEFNNFERLIDYGRNKLATDVDDYAIEWLLQSDFIDSGNKATEAGRNLLDNLYHFQNPHLTLGENLGRRFDSDRSSLGLALNCSQQDKMVSYPHHN